jgi:radical SAM superfamily enzyme YgiQ (UPF0313 family)
MKQNTHKKVLLASLPYWTPQIPPLGISLLKTQLRPHGFDVTAVDLNVEEEFHHLEQEYFNTMKTYIPPQMRGNFHNVGNDVLRNHLMFHWNAPQRDIGLELLRISIEVNFFVNMPDKGLQELDLLAGRFYRLLEDYFTSLLEREKPDVLGLSVFSGNFGPSLFTFRMTRQKFPRIMTVMGGGVFADQLSPGSPNFDMFMKQADYIDKIIVGEGEVFLTKLLSGQLPADQRVFLFQDFEEGPLALSAIGLPDYSDLHLDRYPYMASFASRSCPFQCSFCSETVQWGKYRKKDPERIAGELLELSNKHQNQLFLMGDSLLNPVVNGLSQALIDRGGGVYWDGYIRADKEVCNVDNTILWRRGGYYRARLGMESGSQRVLKLMGKKISPAQIKEALSSLAHAGIKTTSYWVIGHPGETESDFQQTLDLIAEMKNEIYEAECNPFNFYMAGQVVSDQWVESNRPRMLYPEEAWEYLILQTWILDGEPSRFEMHDRVRRFVDFCRRLGIPNPYSFQDIRVADERWTKLHKNAVPPMMEFKKGEPVDDDPTGVKKLSMVKNTLKDDDEWNF